MRGRGIVAAALCLAFASTAAAQSVTIASVTRSSDAHRDSKLYWVSQADCLADVVFTFSLTLSGATDGLWVEAWAGISDCSSDAARAGGSASTCWLVAPALAAAPTLTIPVHSRYVAAYETAALTGNSGLPPFPDASVCVALQGQQALTITVLLANDTGISHGQSAEFNSGFDIAPPDPPTNVNGSGGYDRVQLSWTRSDSVDVVAYRFFCDVPSTRAISDSEVLGCHATDAGADTVAPFQCGQVQGGAATSGVVVSLTPDVLHSFLVSAVDEVGNVSGHEGYFCATPYAPPPPAPQSNGCGCMLLRTGPARVESYPLVIASLLAAARRRRRRPCAVARLRNTRRQAPQRLVPIQVTRNVSTGAALRMNSRAE